MQEHDTTTEKGLRQHLFNNDYISNPLSKWHSGIIVILNFFLTTVYNKKTLLK
jgi:hypothetical protein